MKSIRRAIAIILLFAVLTSLPVLAASDGLFCTFDTSDLTLEIGSIFNVSGIVYSRNLHITEVSVSIYTPTSGDEDAYSICVITGDDNGEAEFDLTDCYELSLAELGDYLIKWTAFTKEGVGFSHPIEKSITVVERGGGSTSDGSFEDRVPLGEASGETPGTIGDDSYEIGSFEAPDLILEPIGDQEENDGCEWDTDEKEPEDSWFFEDESEDHWLVDEEEHPSADIPESSSLTLHTSEKGIAFIKAWESCRLYVYDDATNKRWDANSKGNPTIGYGHKLVSGDGLTTFSTITTEEAEALFLQDLARREAVCDEFLRLTGAEVTQNQYDALSSFFYNGNSFALDRRSFMFDLFSSNAKSISDIPAWKIYNQFANYYTKSNASVRQGLLKRRLDEARIFTDAIYERFDWIIPEWAKQGEAVPDEWYPEELQRDMAPLSEEVQEGDAASEIPPRTSVFTDVSVSDPCYNAIERMFQRGIISGTSSGRFNPDDTLTRAQGAVLLCKLIGLDELSRSKTEFSDVNKSHWASGYIKYCYAIGLMSGYGDQRFGPDDPLTLQQFCTLLVKLLGESSRAERLGGWPDGYVAAARELGLFDNVSGKSGSFTRKYAALMLDNLLSFQSERLENSEYVTKRVVGNASDASIIYLQTDDKWIDDTYGRNEYKEPASFYASACGVFALVNAIHAVTGHNFSDEEIRNLADFSVREGYRVDGQGTRLALVTGAAAEYGKKWRFDAGETLRYLSPEKNSEVIKSINNCLNTGGAIVFSVWTANGGGHLMTITNRRLNSAGESEYLLLDSFSSSNRLGYRTNSGWVKMDNELDLITSSGNKIVTKGGKDPNSEYGFWCIFPTP